MSERSIVEYFAEHERYSCGYCKNDSSSYSHGMWGHCLTPQDYQDLIDRGWRRSGKYCYKPNMGLTCCPQYAIRCDALKFKLSKSQKKVLKRMHKFLMNGRDENEESQSNNLSGSSEQRDQQMDFENPTCLNLTKENIVSENISLPNTDAGGESTSDNVAEDSVSLEIDSEKQDTAVASESVSPKSVKHCRKAKDLRRERRLQKLLNAGVSMEEALQTHKTKQCEIKSIEDFLTEPFSSEPKHRLELRLVRSDSSDAMFSKTLEESYEIYQKYQTVIHGDPPEKCSKKQYFRFLVTNPYQYSEEEESKYGSYHQQYWIDDKLIAVGVIDILPYCVSSVYLYYDPDYSFLSLGTYASLREIAFTREIHQTCSSVLYYYMGFYIHSCPKMRYKGAYFPSSLLCPETYKFLPIEKCLPKLDASKYSRLAEDSRKSNDLDDVDGVVNMWEVLILFQGRVMTYHVYRQLHTRADHESVVRQYAGFVGRKCYRRMLLYRS